MRGLGGDQIAWSGQGFFMHTEPIIQHRRSCRYYLESIIRSKSGPAPTYNTVIHPVNTTGICGTGRLLQPEAGNFGYELVNLYKITGTKIQQPNKFGTLV
jgi:hypothetical protein